MATTTGNTAQAEEDNTEAGIFGYSDDSDSVESLASNNTDDGQEHAPEKILAELQSTLDGSRWYLVKWKDCPVLRSSWERYIPTEEGPSIFADWEVEKQRQEKGESTPLDINSFVQAVEDIEHAERLRRTLRRFKREVSRTISILANE